MATSFVPLAQAQVQAAERLYLTMPDLNVADAALRRLREAMPVNDGPVCLLKTVAVNSLYGTNIYAVVRMAKQVEGVLNRWGTRPAGAEMVDEVAAMPVEGGRPRRFTSFASKFCHFFVDEDRCPIYDEAARATLKLHLGKGGVVESKINPYGAFCTNIEKLKSTYSLKLSNWSLDRYLWIVGLYLDWERQRKSGKIRINVTLGQAFEQPNEEQRRAIREMLPERWNV